MVEPIVVIPARWGSSRFPGKPLTPIVGASGEAKPLIQRTWEAGKASGMRVIVATDDNRIAEVAEGFGAEVTITPDCANGTERCAAVAAIHLMKRESVIINLQGDACLTPPEWLTDIADMMRTDHPGEAYDVATMVAPLASVTDAGVVCYTDIYGKAVYFGRERPGKHHPMARGLAHFGVYAYRVQVLHEYVNAGRMPLETMEDLEQNRWLHLGVPIRAVWPPEDEFGSVRRLPTREVNERADVVRVQEELARWGIE